MSVPSLTELVAQNYTGDVEWLETLIPVSRELEVIQWDSSTSSTSSPTVTEASKKNDTALLDPDKKLTKQEAEEMKQSEKEYKEALAFVKDMIAPSMMRIDATKLQIGDTYVRTIFTYAILMFLKETGFLHW